jgi:bifunctional UDP-N-acetylglucosamine pyrophosphorylase/glucosamine-1-phosphate N-acetyltransferase
MLEIVADVVAKVSKKYHDYKINKILITSNHILEKYQHLLPKDYQIVVQNNPQGTGHAMQIALPYLIKENSKTVMLYGDTPLITENKVIELIDLLESSDIAILGFNCRSKNDQYGRLIVDNGKVKEIIEYKDATEQQRENRLCNSGLMSFHTKMLEQFLPMIDNKNKNNEYYVVDVIKFANQNGHNISLTMSDIDSIGVNNQIELAEANKIMQKRIQEKLMLSGVTIVDPENTFISYDAVIPSMVTISPFVYIDRGIDLSGIVNGYKIKPFSKIDKDNCDNLLTSK